MWVNCQVYLKDYLLKDAAKILDINYSTAKTILRIFRLEKRVEKKNADEDRELKSYINSYIHNEHGQSGEALTHKNIELINSDTNSTRCTNFKFLIKEENPLEKTLSSNGSQSCSESVKNEITSKTANSALKISANIAETPSKNTVDEFSKNFQKLSTSIENCYSMIKSNQMFINNLMSITMNMTTQATQQNKQNNTGKIILLIFSSKWSNQWNVVGLFCEPKLWEDQSTELNLFGLNLLTLF